MKNYTDNELVEKYQETENNSYMDELLIRYKSLLHKRAGKFHYKTPAMSYDDLYQEGAIGFMKGIKHFDTSNGATLISYVVHWINSEMFEYANRNVNIVKIATSKYDRKIRNNFKHYETNKRSLTEDEVSVMAKDLDVPIKNIRYVEEGMKAIGHSFHTTQHDGDSHYKLEPEDYLQSSSDVFRDPAEIYMENEVPKVSPQEFISVVQTKIGGFGERMADIIQKRIIDEKPTTLQELSETYGISLERVRQIEAKARKTFVEYSEYYPT